MKKSVQITIEGKKELEAELEALKGRRGEVAEKIASARDHGDLRENAEYAVAREEQSVDESRILEIEDILRSAEIIEVKKSSTVQVGSTVELGVGKTTVSYCIVGPVEADPLEGKISNESPIGAALLGCKVGDTVKIETPKGTTAYTIKTIG